MPEFASTTACVQFQRIRATGPSVRTPGGGHHTTTLVC
jgi:hypothetical protein